MWIEHLDPVSLDSSRINDYENCVYVCRFCNQSRATAPPVDSIGRRLLNPARNAWGERFSTSGDRLLPAADDPDALYTFQTYNLNDPRKVEKREQRRIRLAILLPTLMDGPAAVETLIALAERVHSLADANALLETAAMLQANISYAFSEIQRYLAVPPDADILCPCGSTDHHHLPEWLAAQVQILS